VIGAPANEFVDSGEHLALERAVEAADRRISEEAANEWISSERVRFVQVAEQVFRSHFEGCVRIRSRHGAGPSRSRRRASA
jgi:hypothetical protein